MAKKKKNPKRNGANNNRESTAEPVQHEQSHTIDGVQQQEEQTTNGNDSIEELEKEEEEFVENVVENTAPVTGVSTENNEQVTNALQITDSQDASADDSKTEASHSHSGDLTGIPNLIPEETSSESDKESPIQHQPTHDPAETELSETIDPQDDSKADNSTTTQSNKETHNNETSETIDDTIVPPLPEQSVESHPQPSPSLSLLSMSPGPYSVHELIPNLELPSGSKVTVVESYKSNLYIGTDQGEILHYTTDSHVFKLISTTHFHSTRHSPIRQIEILPTISKALITSSSLLQVFTIPEITHSNIGKIKDVNYITKDHDHKAREDSNGVHVTVFTKERIRIVNVTQTALRLVKDIAFGNVIIGLRRGEFSVVCGADSEYDLIDLENDGKITLFPLSTDGGSEKHELQPFVLPISQDEFLLASGTTKEESAMGLVININGDISRGTIPFDTYPDSLEVDDLLLLAAFDKNKDNVVSDIVVYSVHDQSELQRLSFGIKENDFKKHHKVKVRKVSSGFKQIHNGLADLIKLVPLSYGVIDEARLESEKKFATDIAQIESDIIIHNDVDNSLSLLVSRPRLQRLTSDIPKDKVINISELEDELKSTDSSTELGCVEIEFLNTFIALSHLRNHNFSASVLDYFINGTIDPRILLYIFDPTVIFGDVWVFNGLVSLMQELSVEYESMKKQGKSKEKDLQEIEKFIYVFLEDWLKKEYVENKSIIKSLRIMKLKRSLNNHDVLMGMLEQISDYEEALEILQHNGKHRAVAEIFLKKGEYLKSMKVLRKLVDGELPEHDRSPTAKESTVLLIIDLIYKHFASDKDIIDDYGKWLLKVDATKGMSFFNKLKSDSDDELMILEQIDDLGLQLEYVEKVLVKLKKERNLGNLRKNLYKALLRSK